MNELKRIGNSSEERAAYEARAKYMSDYKSNMEGSRDEGIALGIEIGQELGRNEGIEIGKLEIIKSLKGIIDDEIIAEKTGLPLEEIKKI